MNCIFCHNPKFKESLFENTVFNNKEFKYLTCEKCRLVQISPLPDLKDYEAMYTIDYYHYETNIPNPKFDYIFYKLNSNHKSFLDYGCGSGRVLVNAIDRGLNVIGADFGSELILHLKSSYPLARFYEIEEFYKSTEKYDVIFLSNVFEHLINPNEIMQMLYNKLNHNGLFIVEGPIEYNYTLAGLFREILFGIRKNIFNKKVNHAPRHIFYSNQKNQLDFFKNSGLETIEYKLMESSWPFPDSWTNSIGFKNKLFYLIAKLSFIIDKIIPKSGNNFFYIGKKNK